MVPFFLSMERQGVHQIFMECKNYNFASWGCKIMHSVQLPKCDFQKYKSHLPISLGTHTWSVSKPSVMTLTMSTNLRLDSNINSVTLNKTYINIVEIFNKLFKKTNNIKIENLIVSPTQKRGYFRAILSWWEKINLMILNKILIWCYWVSITISSHKFGYKIYWNFYPSALDIDFL